MGKTPNELIEMKKKTLERKGDRRENMVLEGKLRQFMDYLDNEAVTAQGRKGYGLGSRKIAYSGVVSFFDLNQYPLSMKRGDRPSGEAIGSRIPEKSEVVKLLNTAKSRRHRGAILLLKDSGLRESDAIRLKWSEIIDFGEGFWGWKIITQKNKVRALPFVGPETTRALKQLRRKSERIFPITAKTLSNAICLLIDEAGLEPGLSAHGLRKYFNAELQAARVPKEWRYLMMGKKTGAYDENRHTRLLEAYKEAYGYLEIYGARTQDINAIVEKRVQDIEQKYARLEAAYQALEMKHKTMMMLTDPKKLEEMIRSMVKKVKAEEENP